jgi:MSHA biogenesis protein MshO
MSAASGPARGVTLIELVVVMAILGIIAAVAAMSVREPIQAYVDSNRRAELTDMADTALRRVGRDTRLALPNSVRVTGVGPVYLELLLTRTGGRYRANVNDTGAGDPLDFTAGPPTADNQFDTLGPMGVLAGQAIAAGDILVVYNLFSDPAITNANAYTYNQAAFGCTSATQSSANCNTATIAGTGAGALAGETRISFDRRQFPLASPGNRFQVVQGPVTYVCNANGGALDANGNGTGTLTRVHSYAVQLAQPSPPAGGTSAVLAQFVTACEITYNPSVLTQARGLVSMRLALTRANETVSLYHEVHVNNVP